MTRHAHPQNDAAGPAVRRDGPSDGALVLAAQAGSRAAVEALFQRHFRAAHALAFTLVGDPREIDDLVQESMLSALRKLSNLRDPEAFRPWLAKHVVFMTRRLFRRRRLLARLGIMTHAPSDFDALVSPAAPPDVAADLRTLYRAVQALPPKPRIAFLLRRVEGLELGEVAGALDASLTSVKRWLADAERQLHKEMRRP
jgi:RNA polymerase sigma-70 factor (ECF subfamily)